MSAAKRSSTLQSRTKKTNVLTMKVNTKPSVTIEYIAANKNVEVCPGRPFNDV